MEKRLFKDALLCSYLRLSGFVVEPKPGSQGPLLLGSLRRKDHGSGSGILRQPFRADLRFL